MFRKLFFPIGKCHPKYTNYIKWSFTSNVLLSTEYALATHSMLHAINTDSETMRTLNYVGKDIIGQMGGLMYMSKMGDKADKEPVKFLQYSNGIEQVGLLATCSTPLLSSYFLPIAGISNIFSNLSFIGYGAINAKCIQTMAIDNNIGELYSKITMINMLGSSVGLILGVSITFLIPDHTTRLGLVPFLGIARVYTFNMAVKDFIQ